MMLILIPCSNRKCSGGDPAYAAETSIQSALSPDFATKLLHYRAELARILNLAPGRDLGMEASANVTFLSAYKRYTGNLYHRAALTSVDAEGAAGAQILIVSALYGLVGAMEPIRHYNLQMKCRLPNGSRVWKWWRERQLGSIVLEAIKSMNVNQVHDLLTPDYRKALHPWPPPSTLLAYRPHEYPGLGSGSNYHRGKDVRDILDCNSLD